MNIKTHKALSISSLLLLALILSNCTGAFKSMIKDDGKQIPSDLGKTKVTILVFTNSARGYDKYLEKNWKKYYTGDYLIIRRNEIDQYTDKEKYRYIFDDDMSNNNFIDAEGGGKNLKGYSYSLYDRKEKKIYGLKIESGLYSKLMIAYIKKMNEVRAKNGDQGH